jgi:hypothetical protein
MKPKRSSLCRPLTAALMTLAFLHAEEAPQQEFTFTQGGGNSWNADWNSTSLNRTFFAQGSVDLENWLYLPVIEFGTGSKGFGTDGGGTLKYFIRLVTIDYEWVTSLQDARDADFDGDGIPNWFELEEIFSDPFDFHSNGGDSDLDGLGDGWELYHFGNLTAADASGDPDADSLTNAYEAALGTDPQAGVEMVAESGLQLHLPN